MEDLDDEATQHRATGKTLFYSASVIGMFVVAALALFLGHLADEAAIELPSDVLAAQAAARYAPPAPP